MNHANSANFADASRNMSLDDERFAPQSGPNSGPWAKLGFCEHCGVMQYHNPPDSIIGLRCDNCDNVMDTPIFGEFTIINRDRLVKANGINL